MHNVLLLAHVQRDKALFTPMLLVLLSCKSQLAQGHFWALDHCYLSDKWFENYLAGASPVPGRTFLRLTLRRSCWQQGFVRHQPKQGFSYLYFFWRQRQFASTDAERSVPSVYVPRHPELAGMDSDQCFYTLTPSEYLCLTFKQYPLSESHNFMILFLTFSYIR